MGLWDVLFHRRNEEVTRLAWLVCHFSWPGEDWRRSREILRVCVWSVEALLSTSESLRLCPQACVLVSFSRSCGPRPRDQNKYQDASQLVPLQSEQLDLAGPSPQRTTAFWSGGTVASGISFIKGLF